MCRASDIMEEEEGETKKVEVDIYKVIQEKEHDLMLAAELGKVLLDKNEEISQIREKIVLDYTQRLEVQRGTKIIRDYHICTKYHLYRPCHKRNI